MIGVPNFEPYLSAIGYLYHGHGEFPERSLWESPLTSPRDGLDDLRHAVRQQQIIRVDLWGSVNG